MLLRGKVGLDLVFKALGAKRSEILGKHSLTLDFG